MKIDTLWPARPKAALCLLGALAALSAAVLISSNHASLRRSGESSYAVTIRHYGVDAREMERTIAVPLEDALYGLHGVRSVTSSSENGMVRVLVRFSHPVPGTYEAVRDAAERVYEGLPITVQRPELVSSDDSRIPVWSAAVSFSGEGNGTIPMGLLLEREVKPLLGRIEGAGEVEISGTGLREITVALDPAAAAARGLDAAAVAAALGADDVLAPGGIVREDGRELLIVVDGRYGDASELRSARIPLREGTSAALSEIAGVSEGDRRPDILSRLDGKEAAVVSVMGAAGVDAGRLSAAIQRETAALARLGLKLTVLADRGAEEAAAARSVLSAALQGALAVAAATAFMATRSTAHRGNGRRKARAIAAGALAVPVIALFSAALLAVLGFPPDRMVLAGLAAGLGAAVDAAILSSERLLPCRGPEQGRRAMASLVPSLISGTATTVVVLVPLAALDSLAGSVNSIAWSIGVASLVSLVAALLFLPPLLLADAAPSDPSTYSAPPARRRPWKVWTVSGRLIFRSAAAGSVFCLRRPRLYPVAALCLSAAGILALLRAGADIAPVPSEDSVYAQAEFAGGLRAEAVDVHLTEYAAALRSAAGVRSVQTGARVASGSILLSFDPTRMDAEGASRLLRETPIPGGFVFIPEPPVGERLWTITVAGDDDRLCRESAEAMAARCAEIPYVRETVLHFKEGSERLFVMPERERTAALGLPFARAGDLLRRAVHGPPAYKRLSSEGETDVRVHGRSASVPDRSEVFGLLLTAGASTVRLDSITATASDRESSGIRREDRRRTASFSVRTGPMDPRRLRDRLMPILSEGVPPGYSVEFDRNALERAEALSGIAWLFLAAALLCYMAVAAAGESFTVPLAVLSVLPPSMAVPALFVVAAGYPVDTALACAFVAVAGMAVNASVLTVEELRQVLSGAPALTPPALYRALRRRLPALSATTATTVVGAVPFLFLPGAANGVVRSLALVTTLGVGSSFVCSLTLVPALAVLNPGLFRTFSGSACAESISTVEGIGS